MTTPTSVKLLIDPKSNTVLFAEAGKDFVDFLFNIMSFPVSTVVTLIDKQGTPGSTGNIYESIHNLGSSDVLSIPKKLIFLTPMVANYDANVALLLPRPRAGWYTNLYMCTRTDKCLNFVTNDQYDLCCYCNTRMDHNLNFANPRNNSYASDGGLVKEAAKFMVTDDLVVRPMSTESILDLFNKFNIKDISGLEVKVSRCRTERVELLRTLMQSKTVLTEVFLAEKKQPSIKSDDV